MSKNRTNQFVIFFTILVVASLLAGGLFFMNLGGEEEKLTIYSGRSEDLIGPIIESFENETGINVEVKYGSSTDQANLIVQEGEDTPADIFIAQDAGNLGSLENENLLANLDGSITSQIIDRKFVSDDSKWVGVSGRARSIVYNTNNVNESDLPSSLFDLCNTRWDGKIGWAPTNASFQSFVSAIRAIEGEERAREWLNCVVSNNPVEYPKNTPIVEAAARGEIEIGLVNHYYLYRILDEFGEETPIANYFIEGDLTSFPNVAGVGIIKDKISEDAEKFVNFLLNEESQKYFADETNEYPIVEGIEKRDDLPALEKLGPEQGVDFSMIDDIQGTIDLLEELEIL